MKKEGLDLYLVTDVKNIYYLTNWLETPSASLSLTIPLKDEPTLLATPLSFQAAKSQTQYVSVECLPLGENFHNRLVTQLINRHPKRLGYDSLPLKTYLQLTRSIPAMETVAAELIVKQRRTKDKEEIAYIRKACEHADEAMDAALEAIRPGIREYEVAAQAEYTMRMLGSEGPAFETLVASGPRSSYPHGVSTDRKINDGDLVTVDLGSIWKGYCSDITRTIVAGTSSPKDQRLIKIVQSIHDRILEMFQPGFLASKIDAEARRMLSGEYRQYFIHGLGHGVGLEIHEAPSLSQSSVDVLAVGNVVTDEPGIYLADYGGVRIEDTVLITENGSEKLTGHTER
jgi:Xaa-Pro dipeptidase